MKVIVTSLAERKALIKLRGTILIFFTLFVGVVGVCVGNYWLFFVPVACFLYVKDVEFSLIMSTEDRKKVLGDYVIENIDQLEERKPNELNKDNFEKSGWGMKHQDLGTKWLEKKYEEHKIDKEKWEKERSDLLVKLNAATASSQLYRELLHDLVS